MKNNNFNRKPIVTFVLTFLCILSLGITSARIFADGDETLGTPSITIASGSGIVASGTGLLVQPGIINLDVPSGATITQVLIYWHGDDAGCTTTDTITVDGNSVTGGIIGSRVTTLGQASAFRADITSLGLVSDGTNTLTVDGLDFDINNGAGVLVIFDDGSTTATIDIRDGSDFAFALFAPPLQSTVPQTFAFPSSSLARTANLDMFFASVSGTASGDGFRPSAIEVTVGGTTTVFDNILDSNDGDEWDTLNLVLDIPANTTSLTVQALSQDNDPPSVGPGGETEGLVASFYWLTAGLSILEPTSEPGEIGDTVFCDIDDDGVQDPGEPGIPGVTITLTCPGVVRTEVTDVNGKYLFTDVEPDVMCSVVVDQSSSPALDDKVIGQCPETFDVTLQPGESFLDADFCFKNEGDPTGCTPGYWRQSQHFDSWTAPLVPSTLFSDVFCSSDIDIIKIRLNPNFGRGTRLNPTLLEAVWASGGGINALARHAVAALLNASTNIDYPLSVDDVKTLVCDALADGSNSAYNDAKDIFEAFNELGCPLD